MVDLSIIIVSYNTKDITKTCLETVIDSLNHDRSIKAEIIVVDNNSDDGSREMLEKKNVVLICNKENVGFGAANNQAVKKAEGTYILFLNSDVQVIKNAIPKLYHQFGKSAFAFAGAKLFNKDLTIQQSCGRFYTLPIAFISLFLKGDSWGISRYSPHTVSNVDWVSGACIITTKNNFDTIKGFDESIFMYWDEVDLLYRARKNHMKTGFFPEPKFIHLEGSSSSNRTGPILKVYEGYIFFYKKHYSPLNLRLLKYMLKLKALIGIVVGSLIGNSYLVDTYSRGYEIVKKN